MTATDPKQPVKNGWVLDDQVRYLTYTLCLAALVLLSACEEWPPHQQQLKSDFFDHESDYRLLAEMLLDSKYVSVAAYDETEVFGVFIQEDDSSEQKVDSERLPNEDDWLGIFRRSGIEEVERESNGDGSVFIRKSNFRSDLLADTDWYVGYTNDSSLRDILKQCRDISRDLPCGFCVSELQDEWLISYSWFPASSEVFDTLRDDDVSEAEAVALATENSSKCLRENWEASFK